MAKRRGKHHGVVAELAKLIESNGWEQRFESALASAKRKLRKHEITTFPQLDDISRLVQKEVRVVRIFSQKSAERLGS